MNPADIEEAQRRNSPSRFARLWRGVWSTAGGDALEEKDIQAAVTLPGPIMERHPMEGCVAGLDLGIEHDHWRVVVLVDFDLRRAKSPR